MESLDKPWKQSYYLPTPADAGVSTFRSWMDAHAGGRVAWAPGVADDASKVKSEAEQLDRYHRHTKHCVACKTALAELGVLEERCVLASKYLLAGRCIPRRHRRGVRPTSARHHLRLSRRRIFGRRRDGA